MAAGVAGVHGAGWLYATRRVEAELSAWLDGQRQAGWTITSGAPQRTGWPFAATVLLPQLAVDGSGAGVPATWMADEVAVGVTAAHPGTLRVVTAGAQRWRLGPGGEIGVTADVLSLSTDGMAMAVTARGLAVTGLAGVGPGSGATAASLDIEAAGLDFALRLVDVAGDGLPWPTADIAVQGNLTRPILAAADLPAAVAAWRDAGGVAVLRTLTLAAPPLHATASGTAGLDGALQPVLDLKAVVGGYRPALDRLVQAGKIPASVAVAAKAVLGLLSGRDPDAPAALPVRAAGGVVTMAGFALFRLPPLSWGAGVGPAGRRSP